tara:strand:+ start:3972 stop:4961 length:990 start_codon:yes stop_codon:yes gene_type:complete
MMRPWLHRFAWFTAGCTFVLIVAGGLVTSTGSGLSVPDWPLSYGTLMPPMVAGIFYEHGHRMIASFVGLLTVCLAVWVWRVEPRRWVRLLSLAALVAVVVQGIIGGLTVIYLLPTALSVTHACLAQTFFCATLVLALALRPGGQDLTSAESEAAARVRKPALILFVVIYVQLILGALVRHTEAGLAIPDFPLSFGHLFPPLSELSTNPNAPYPIPLAELKRRVMTHYLHRVWAVAATGVVFWFAWCVIRRASEVAGLVQLATSLVALVVVQVLLGASVVWSQKGVAITTAHVAVGAAILGTCAVAVAMSRGWVPVSSSSARMPLGEPAS